MSDTVFLRDLAITTLVFGVAAFIWFGWGHENPPRSWRVLMITGSAVSCLMIIVGAVLTWQLWGADSVFHNQATRRAFGIVCGVEFGLCGLGAALLASTKRQQLIAPWILLVVGAHFVPLSVIFRDPGLNVLAVAMLAGAASAVILHRRRQITPSAITALTGGGALLIFAVRSATLAVI